jgi:sulfur dioxygenase
MDNYLFSGDTLLINGTGRTDFQNGSSKDAYNSIFNRLLKLPEDTTLYPGHDYNGKVSSTIGNEKKFNPRLQVKNVDEYVELMSNLNLAKPKLIDTNVSRNIKLGAN